MITVTGLGPGDLDRVPQPVREFLLDEQSTLIIRTFQHPAAADLATMREVVFCDDLYDSFEDIDAVYQAIADRVITAAERGPVIYAVPGSPLIGEFAVRKILDTRDDVTVVPAESFLDAVLFRVGYDPLDRGLQILNGHDLPDPLILDKPTVIGHLDRPELLADVLDSVARVVSEEAVVTVLSGVGSTEEKLVTAAPESIDTGLAGIRTSIFLDTQPGGLIGAVQVMRRLREECPWDQEQTHQSLVKNLVEETYELIEAISGLDEQRPDWVAYARVEDELGDVLLQVLFHEAIARQTGGFDIDGVAEVLRQKLVRRHPHVFAAVEVADADEVKRNWDQIKEEENDPAGSILDGVPANMPGLQRAAKIQNRAAKVGFDWNRAEQVIPKVREEVGELEAALSGDGDVAAELGDLLFSVINLARHLGVDPELALRNATATFERRFRRMESEGPLQGLDIDELDRRWETAKAGLDEV